MQGLIGLGSKLFWRLTASYFAVLLVTSAIVVLLLDRDVARADLDVEQRLGETCLLLSPMAERLFAGELDVGDAQADMTAVGERTGMRVTLIQADGEVVLDTHRDPVLMETHGDRPEVLDAYGEEFGVASRTSHTVGYPMLYVAHLLRREGQPLGLVRTSYPMQLIQASRASTRQSVFVGAGIGLVTALCLSLWVARRITAPIEVVTRVAEDLRAGRYESRVPRLGERGEIGVLAAAMNRMGRELTSRIASMTREDARMKAMLAGMVEGVIAVDDADSVAFCNDAARRLLSIGSTELVGRPLWEVVRIEGFVETVAKARDAGSPQSSEFVLGSPPGERFVTAHASPFEAGQEEAQRGLVIVLHDTTELRRLERVRRDFVANVSHELKTPLASIKGFVETLLAGALHDEAVNERFLSRIADNVQRLNHLVSDLLSLARIEAASGSVPREPVSMNEIVVRVVDAHVPEAEAKGLELVSDAKVRQVVYGDPEALEQVVGNLVTNAIHYTSEGKVYVRLRNQDGRGILEVEDTGEGIPREDLDRVFERFYRVDKARSRSVGGTGLGLSIVRNLVQAMQGQVSVESVLNSGSTFEVSLELASSGI